jgi:hypothetical protein
VVLEQIDPAHALGLLTLVRHYWICSSPVRDGHTYRGTYGDWPRVAGRCHRKVAVADGAGLLTQGWRGLQDGVAAVSAQRSGHMDDWLQVASILALVIVRLSLACIVVGRAAQTEPSKGVYPPVLVIVGDAGGWMR